MERQPLFVRICTSQRSIALLLATALAACALLLRGVFSHGSAVQGIDFAAFYCAAKVYGEHGNPYLAHALSTCELPLYHLDLDPQRRIFVVPAPFPGIFFLLLAPLGRLPYATASMLWSTALAISFAVILGCVRALTGLPLIRIAAVCAFLGYILPLQLGQAVPLIVAFLCVSARLYTRDAPQLAAVFATATLLEPHLGVPVVAALFIYERRARLTLVAGCAIFLGGCFAASGTAGVVQYVRDVIPAQALSEFRHADQYSLGYLLAFTPLSPVMILRICSLTFALGLMLSVWAAPRLAQRWQSPSAVILAPPAFVLLLGPYLHSEHLLGALPVLLLFYARERQKYLRIAAAVLALIIGFPAIEIFVRSSFALQPSFGSIPWNAAHDSFTTASEIWRRIVAADEPDAWHRKIALFAKLPTIFALLLLPPVLSFAAASRSTVAPAPLPDERRCA